MSVRKREGSPFFWYSFTINGHRFRGSTEKTSKREALDTEADQKLLAKQSLAAKTDWTLQAVLSTYWNERAKDLNSSGDILGHFADLQRILGKNKKAVRITPGDLMDYRARRRGERRRGKAPAMNSINRDFAYLRAALEHCRKHHQHPMPNIDWKALRAQEPPGRRRFLAKEEYVRLMAEAHPSLRAIIVCAVATGLRRENILSLDWKQVQLGERMIHVRVKGNKEHSVKITGALLAMLSTMPNRKGKVFDRTNFRRRWADALAAAELHDFKFHDLRHTFASWARQEGADLADICDALNHSSMSMTMRYAHIKPGEHRTAFDRVSDSLLGTIQGTPGGKVAENGGKAND